MKPTVTTANAHKERMLRKKLISGRYTERDVDEWMRSMGAEPIPPREAARLRKKGLLGMPDE